MSRTRILVSLITENNDYQREQVEAVLEVSRRFGVGITVVYGDNNPVTQSRQILSYIHSISERPDAIICHPVESALPRLASAAIQNQIGWVILNREMEYVSEIKQVSKVPAFCVTVDQEEIGRIQARQIGALLPNGGTVLYIQGNAGNFAAEKRTTGIFAMQPKNVHIHPLRGSFTEASGYEAIRSWLSLSNSHQSDVRLVVSQNDNMAAGAYTAFMDDSATNWKHLLFTGCDAGPTGRELVRTGVLAASISLPRTAGLALELLIHALDTGTSPGSTTVLMPSSYPALEVLKAKVQSR